MNNTDKAYIVLMCLLALIVSCFSIDFTQQYYRRQAVRHGAAHWTVDENGKSEFVWNNVK